jgi:hypothetical protein
MVSPQSNAQAQGWQFSSDLRGLWRDQFYSCKSQKLAAIYSPYETFLLGINTWLESGSCRHLITPHHFTDPDHPRRVPGADKFLVPEHGYFNRDATTRNNHLLQTVPEAFPAPRPHVTDRIGTFSPMTREDAANQSTERIRGFHPTISC